MPTTNPGVSKGDFLGFIKKASQDQQLLESFLTEAYQPGKTPEDLLDFFEKKRYYGVSLEDCRKLKDVISVGPLPCNFSGGNQY